jgi:hypothetical protein
VNEEVESDTAFVANCHRDPKSANRLRQHFLLWRKKLCQVQSTAVDRAINIQEKLTIIGIGLSGYGLLE